MGQALLPEHLYALEESMLADSATRFSLHGLSCYGMYELRWNQALLAQGVLALEDLTLVLPSGLLLALKKKCHCNFIKSQSFKCAIIIRLCTCT